MQNGWTVGIIAGLVSAVLFASALFGSMLSVILMYLSPLPLLIIGLGWGVKSVALAAGAGTLTYVLLTEFWGGLIYAATIGAPALLLTHLALLSRPAQAEAEPSPAPSDTEWYPAGRLLGWMSAIAVALFLVPHLVMTGDGGLPNAIRGQLPTVVPDATALTTQFKEAGISLTSEELFDMIASILPGAMISVWLLLMSANLLLAQKIVRVSGRAIRSDFDLVRTDLPQELSYALAGALVLALLPGSTGFAGGTAAVVLAIPFFIMGLITVHVVSAGWVTRSASPSGLAAARAVGLFLVYALILMQSALAVLVCILGIADQWMNLRRRALAPVQPKESE